ncbi:MAG: FAD-dependent oxidoreductase [Acutalibacteraceae bacterium]|nr:FAD-dependent oxidoreductase [Acutalibacteraceae bacterium]
MGSVFKTIEYNCDLCIVGGGLAGTIASLAAARSGAKVVLIQDRPVLGGNCSSEIRMWVRGAKGVYNRETGILAEFEEENIYRNPTLAPTIWDSVLYGKVKENENITLLLNTSCLDAESEDDTIKSVTAWQMTTYTWHKVSAKFFADCSGDSVLAPLTSAKHRIGREGNEEYNETIGPKVADHKTMGMSILLQARETDHPVKYIPPEWANVYETDEDFASIPNIKSQHSTFRDHSIGTSGCNLWWMELGGEGPAISNTEEMRDELMKVVFGIWDHIKNRGEHGCDNWELEWIGFLPGKRESVRYIGEYVLTQNDILNGGKFEDTIAYGGWPMDDHNPKGMFANSSNETPSIMHPAPSPYGIPYRCLYSKNIKNLFFAGRNISATHAAMSSTRVMGTCALLGQAMGTAAAMCIAKNILPNDIKGCLIEKLQQQLLNDGVFLPEFKRMIPEITLSATTNLTEQNRKILFSGIDRPRSDEEQNMITLALGDSIQFNYLQPTEIKGLRLQFDLDYSRKSVSPNMKMQLFAQKLNVGLDFVPMKVASAIVREFEVYADDELIYKTEKNYNSLVKIPIGKKVTSLSVKFIKTWGEDKIRLFACDLY